MPNSLAQQSTIAREIELQGVGVHSGAPVSIVLHPAEEDVGHRFMVSKRGRIIAEIPASVDQVKNLTLCTVIGDETGVTVGTVEHLLAALRGLAIDNCYIEIEGKEVPIMDGSSQAFVHAIDEVGIRTLSAPRKYIKVLKPVRVDEGDCWGELVPHSGFFLDVEIDFDCEVIGSQRMSLEMSPNAFREELARARTFGFMSDVESFGKLAWPWAPASTIALPLATTRSSIQRDFGIRRSSSAIKCWMRLVTWLWLVGQSSGLIDQSAADIV